MSFFKNTDIASNLTETTEFEIDGDDIDDVFGQVSGKQPPAKSNQSEAPAAKQQAPAAQEGFEVQKSEPAPAQEEKTTPVEQTPEEKVSQSEKKAEPAPATPQEPPVQKSAEKVVSQPSSVQTTSSDSGFSLPDGIEIDGNIHISKDIPIGHLNTPRTVINCQNLIITGNVRCSKIISTGDVKIENNALVVAEEIECNNFSNDGAVKSNIRCSGSFSCNNILSGDVTCASLNIAPTAQINGSLRLLGNNVDNNIFEG